MSPELIYRNNFIINQLFESPPISIAFEKRAREYDQKSFERDQCDQVSYFTNSVEALP